MNKDKLIRYKVLDQCFRNPVGCFSIQELIEQCSKKLTYERFSETSIGERTIREDIKDFQEVYGAVFDKKLKDGKKKLYRYYDTSFSIMPQLFPELSSEKKMLQQILDMLSGYEDVPQYKWLHTFIEQRLNGVDTDGQSVIGFQNNPDLIGMDHFQTLLSAILSKQTILVEYCPYKGNIKKYDTSPYYLKQYNERWFLVAKVEGHSRLSVFPLDRIVSTCVLHHDFIETDIDFNSYFDDVIGITKDERNPIEDVLIKISHTRYPYIQTKPLHYSQTEIKAMSDEEGVVVRVRIRVNKELEAAILQLGNDVEVLQPNSLRENIANKISSLYLKYRNSADTLQC